MFLILTAVLFWIQQCTGLIEIVNENGMQDREFRLTCRHLTSNIAIMEASFTPIIVTDVYDESIGARIYNVTSNYKNMQFIDAEFNIRLALNQRCSGRNHCSFILHVDCPASKLWGPGEIFIKYACMPEELVTKFCNLDLTISEGGGLNAQGFITSPGYPRYYVGQSKCRWKIKAPINQRIEITLLDVSLSVVYGTNNAESFCEDELSVYDGDLVLINTCKEHEKPSVFLSPSNSVEIILLGRSGSLVPKRGILIYYRALECPTLAPPVDGYLVYRNISSAEYMCCVGYVFPDSLKRSRVLKCLQNVWDQNLPTECINIQNATSRSVLYKNTKYKMSDSHLVDVIIPSVLIAGLLVGNAIVVFIIYRFKKRKNVDIREEEMNTMVSGTTVP